MKTAVPSSLTCERWEIQKWIGAEGWYSPFMSRLLASGSSGKWERGNMCSHDRDRGLMTRAQCSFTQRRMSDRPPADPLAPLFDQGERFFGNRCVTKLEHELSQKT